MASESHDYIIKRTASTLEIVNKFVPERLEVHGERNSTFNIGSDPSQTGPTYIFFTKPDLNIKAKVNRQVLGLSPDYGDGVGLVNEQLITELLTGGDSPGQGFIKLYTNRAETIPFNDYQMDVMQIAEAWDHGSVTVPVSGKHSQVGQTLTVEFQDLANNPILNSGHIWYLYVENASKGYIIPTVQNALNKILDYVCSIYIIQTLPDGFTIQYIARYSGAFPIGVPFTSRSTDNKGFTNTKVAIPFAFSFFEAQTADLMVDFNLCRGGVMCTKVKPTQKNLEAGLVVPANESSNRSKNSEWYLAFDGRQSKYKNPNVTL